VVFTSIIHINWPYFKIGTVHFENSALQGLNNTFRNWRLNQYPLENWIFFWLHVLSSAHIIYIYLLSLVEVVQYKWQTAWNLIRPQVTWRLINLQDFCKSFYNNYVFLRYRLSKDIIANALKFWLQVKYELFIGRQNFSAVAIKLRSIFEVEIWVWAQSKLEIISKCQIRYLPFSVEHQTSELSFYMSFIL